MARGDAEQRRPLSPEAGGAEQRRQGMAATVLSRGVVAPAALAKEFGVSLATVHRDLDVLQDRGVLRKVRGGVTAQPSGVFESNVAFRLTSMRAEKQAVARHAARYVEPGMSIILDDSTTALEMVPFLVKKTPLTVATNFLPALQALAAEPSISLIALGGEHDHLHDSFLGVACVDHIERLWLDAAFLSVSAAAQGFAYHQEQRIVAVKRATLASARRSYLLLDHTKLARVALHRLAPLTAFERVIVDPGTPDVDAAAISRDGVHVERALP